MKSTSCQAAYRAFIEFKKYVITKPCAVKQDHDDTASHACLIAPWRC
jgi:hypothetical protein